MTTDLWCLVANVLWGVFLVLLEITGKTRAAGRAWNAGNREKEPVVPEWVARTKRAAMNHQENFPLFLTAVLVVHLAHKNDGTSAAAAMVYVAARAAHGLFYIAGVKGARSGAFLLGLAAAAVILSRLVLGP